MTINSVQEAQPTTAEKRAMTVQLEIQKDVTKDAVQSDTNKQLGQALAYAQPMAQVIQTAREQISRGKIDVKI